MPPPGPARRPQGGRGSARWARREQRSRPGKKGYRTVHFTVPAELVPLAPTGSPSGGAAEITVECLESSSLEQSGKKQRNSQPDARRSSPCSPCSLPRPTRSSPASVPSPRRPRCPCTPAPARRRRSARPGCPVTSASTLWCASTPTTAARRSAPQPIVAIAHHHARLSCAGPRQLRPVGRQRH